MCKLYENGVHTFITIIKTQIVYIYIPPFIQSTHLDTVESRYPVSDTDTPPLLQSTHLDTVECRSPVWDTDTPPPLLQSTQLGTLFFSRVSDTDTPPLLPFTHLDTVDCRSPVSDTDTVLVNRTLWHPSPSCVFMV